MNGWTRLSRQELHSGEFVALYRDRVIRPDGSPGSYEHIAVADTARVLAVDEGNRGGPRP